MITQADLNAMVRRVKAEAENKREESVARLAAVMYARGYRYEELIIFHHEGIMHAFPLDTNCDRWICNDSTRVYLGTRQPIFEHRLVLRRLWRRFRPYRFADVAKIERKVFPLE